MSAILVAIQVALAAIPNCELVTTITIIYTMTFGWEAMLAVIVFSLIEGLIYGFGTWVIGYLYVWPLLVALTMLFKRIIKDDFFVWGIFAGVYGLIFGGLFALEYLVIDKSYALSYWISGIPWDCWHAVTNLLMMWLTGKILKNVMDRCKAYYDNK